MNRLRNTFSENGIGTDWLIAVAFAALAACVIVIWLIFSNFISTYQENIADESANHLIELNAQIKLYMEEKVKNDWRITQSVADKINSNQSLNIDEILDYMKNEMAIWNISDILIITDNGFCIDAEKNIKSNDEASDVMYFADRTGRYMEIVQSTVAYTIPVKSSLTINGAGLSAISVIQNLDSLIDEMDFSSFNDNAYIYLTQSSGAKISQLTHPNAPYVYNVLALFDGYDITCLTNEAQSIADCAELETPHTFLCKNGLEENYAVVTPLTIDGNGKWLLYYIVPEQAVNSTMTGFSNYVVSLSVVVICLFWICAVAAFSVVYKARSKKFDSAIIARDRLFDVLASNTDYAFALLSTVERDPLYVSKNVPMIIGSDYLKLEKTDSGYRMYDKDGSESESTKLINATLGGWDGTGEFSSGFVPYYAGNQLRHFIMRIYPDEQSENEFVAIAQDVTHDRERVEAIKHALKMADSANVAKTRFLANMSHDIRTPMNAIMNMAQFAIEEAEDREKQKEYLNMILDSSDHLLHLINDILDMSRIESGKTVVSAEAFSVRKCLDDVCEMVRPLYSAKQQEFIANFTGVGITQVVGDGLKLAQVLINILNNAIKFTPRGGKIKFIVKDIPSLSESTAALRFIIEDTGIGISEQALEHIFEPFMRADDERVIDTEGSGLGLSICKSYVNAMGGSISCTSEKGAGSRFMIELMFEKLVKNAPAASARGEVAPNAFKGRRALLCEDNEVNRKIACKMLGKLGIETECAVNGKDALEKFCAAEPKYFDIIYMDIRMPILNGYEATLAIRNCGRSDAKTVPIVAMTANVFSEDVEKARASGMNGHIGKPLMLKELALATKEAFNTEENEENDDEKKD